MCESKDFAEIIEIYKCENMDAIAIDVIHKKERITLLFSGIELASALMKIGMIHGDN